MPKYYEFTSGTQPLAAKMRHKQSMAMRDHPCIAIVLSN